MKLRTPKKGVVDSADLLLQCDKSLPCRSATCRCSSPSRLSRPRLERLVAGRSRRDVKLAEGRGGMGRVGEKILDTQQGKEREMGEAQM